MKLSNDLEHRRPTIHDFFLIRNEFKLSGLTLNQFMYGQNMWVIEDTFSGAILIYYIYLNTLQKNKSFIRIDYLYVPEPFRKKGFALLLLTQFFEIANIRLNKMRHSFGIKHIEIQTYAWTSNIASMHIFQEKYSFIPIMCVDNKFKRVYEGKTWPILSRKEICDNKMLLTTELSL